MTVLAVGEILFDEFPSYRRIGGAAFNFAYHLHQLQQPVQLVTRIGRDRSGEDILKILHKAGLDTQTVQVDPHHATGTVAVSLDEEGVPSFDILEDVAYDHLKMNAAVRRALESAPPLLYFGSLVQRSTAGRDFLQDLLSRRRAETRCLYDMNLRPGARSEAVVRASLKQTDILKINEEELSFSAGLFRAGDDRLSAVHHLMRENHIDVVALTCGGRGSELYVGRRRYHQAPSPQIDVVDTVGAGDAYAAMLAIGCLRRWPSEKTLDLCTRIAGRMCTIEGAVPPNGGFYADLVREMG